MLKFGMDQFERNIINTYGKNGEAWLKAVPHLLDQYMNKWNLRPNGQFQNLSFNYVLPVIRSQNLGFSSCARQEDAVLKMGPHLSGRRREAKLLYNYAGQGAVKVLEFSAEDGVLLLEQVRPGDSLRSALADATISDCEATEIAAKLILELMASAKDCHKNGLTSVAVWGLGFEKFLRENRKGTDFPVDKINKADQIFKKLVSSTTEQVGLHGDLHHDNILQSKREPWLAIDPKGLFGDPAYEVGALMRNPMPEIARDTVSNSELDQIQRERLKILAKNLPFSAERMWGWSYSQCILAAIWTVEDKSQDWRSWLRIADSLERIPNIFSAI